MRPREPDSKVMKSIQARLTVEFGSQERDFYRLLREFTRGYMQPIADHNVLQIAAALEKIAGFAGCDLAALTRITEPGTTDQLLGIWHSPDLTDSDTKPDDFNCPWLLSELAPMDVLQFPTLETLPANAVTDCETFQHYEINSVSCLPLSTKSHIVGGLILGAVVPGHQLTVETIERLQILGEILLGNVMQVTHEHQLRDAIKAANIGLWSLNFDNMEFWATKTARVMHGFSETEKISLDKMIAAVHPEDRKFVHQAIERTKATPHYVRAEYRVALPDESLKWLVFRGRSYNNSPSKPNQLWGILINITEKRQFDAIDGEHMISEIVRKHGEGDTARALFERLW